MMLNILVVVSLCVGAFAQNPSLESTNARPQSSQQPAASAVGAADTTNSVPDSNHLILAKGGAVFYPLSAEPQRLQGLVTVKLIVAEDGNVETVETISGDPTLANSVADTLKEWKFKPFIKDGKPVKISTKLSFDFILCDKVVDKGSGVANADGDPAEDTLNGSMIIIRLPGSVTQKMVTHMVHARYPEMAKLARVEGTVVLRVHVGKDGAVESLQVISSASPLLNQAALDAVRKWQYKPYLLRTVPRGFETSAAINFFFQ